MCRRQGSILSLPGRCVTGGDGLTTDTLFWLRNTKRLYYTVGERVVLWWTMGVKILASLLCLGTKLGEVWIRWRYHRRWDEMPELEGLLIRGS